MDSPVTSADITFRSLGGEPIDQPREWAEAFVEVRIDPDDWEDARLLVNGSPAPLTLRNIGGRVRVIASWQRANAGSYILRTALGANVTTRQITILPGKLTSESFGALLADLETRLPASIAIGLQRTGGLAGLKILPPEESTVAQELARLRRAVQGSATRKGLAAVLRELAKDPHQILRSDEVWTRTELARRPHPTRLMHAVRAHPGLAFGEIPARIIDQRVDRTFDVYENRLVRLYHDQVEQRLRRLQRQPELLRSDSLGNEVNSVRAELASARRDAAFLDDVAATSHVQGQVTMVLLKRPAYHAAFEGYLELHRRISIFLNDPRIELPLENLPALYQLWGTLSTCHVLLDVAVRHGYRLEQQHLVRHMGTDIFVQAVPAGELAIRLVHPEHGTVVALTPERSYGSSGAIGSISFSQVPDISITVEPPGEPTRLLLLDPKYKLDSESEAPPEIGGRPKKVDIDKMHAYRDAIRDATGHRVVRGAYTIYPGPTSHYPSGIGALQGIPSQSGELESEIARLIGDFITAAPPGL